MKQKITIMKSAYLHNKIYNSNNDLLGSIGGSIVSYLTIAQTAKFLDCRIGKSLTVMIEEDTLERMLHVC